MNYTKPQNLLLRSLPAEVCQAVISASEFVHLDLHESLVKPGVDMAFVEFPETGVISILQAMSDGALVEVANIGNEGMIGVTALFDSFEIGGTAFCQVEATAVRIDIVRFLNLLQEYPELRRTCERYVVTLLDQLMRNSGCYRTHSVQQRCARWLLSSHDRCNYKSFTLTQEFLALMLGVSRTGVNQAPGALAKANLISYVRGKVVVLDRKGLEQQSCQCYTETTAYYTKIMDKRAPHLVAKFSDSHNQALPEAIINV